MPFVTKVYFKPDTPGLMDWNIKVGERKGTPGKEIGVYQGKSASAWQDELMVGDDLSSHKKMYETLLKDAEARVSDEAEIIPEEDRVPVEALPSRISEADIKGDTTRLDRAMDRTLYFVVKGEDGKWQFPSTALDTEHNLHQVRGSHIPSLEVSANIECARPPAT
jgi:large subunit ribosomal protein L46